LARLTSSTAEGGTTPGATDFGKACTPAGASRWSADRLDKPRRQSPLKLNQAPRSGGRSSFSSPSSSRISFADVDPDVGDGHARGATS
jgi:hypothetical protein